jgi:hypothetical protein
VKIGLMSVGRRVASRRVLGTLSFRHAPDQHVWREDAKMVPNPWKLLVALSVLQPSKTPRMGAGDLDSMSESAE